VNDVNTAGFADSLARLFAELVDGAPKSGGFVLNAGDEGLLRSLDKISAADASVPTPTGSTIAAHVDHLRYGLTLMNRWSKGENPFKNADWAASWRKQPCRTSPGASSAQIFERMRHPGCRRCAQRETSTTPSSTE
jgi:hypothetical protein